LEGKLSKSIKEAPTPAAFIESHRVQVLKAQKQLADRLQQEEIIGQRDKSNALVDLVCDEIKSLNNTRLPSKGTRPIWKPSATAFCRS